MVFDIRRVVRLWMPLWWLSGDSGVSRPTSQGTVGLICWSLVWLVLCYGRNDYMSIQMIFVIAMIFCRMYAVCSTMGPQR